MDWGCGWGFVRREEKEKRKKKKKKKRKKNKVKGEKMKCIICRPVNTPRAHPSSSHNQQKSPSNPRSDPPPGGEGEIEGLFSKSLKDRSPGGGEGRGGEGKGGGKGRGGNGFEWLMMRRDDERKRKEKEKRKKKRRSDDQN